MRKILNALITIVFVLLIVLTIYLGQNYFEYQNKLIENNDKVSKINDSIAELEKEKISLEKELETLTLDKIDEVKEYELWKRKTEELKEKVSL